MRALKDIRLDIPSEKFIVVLGASARAKSTLLNMLGCMDRPTRGSILFENKEITAYGQREMTGSAGRPSASFFRATTCCPIERLENVEFSTEMAGLKRADAERALALVGLSGRMTHFPGQLPRRAAARFHRAGHRQAPEGPAVRRADGALDFETVSWCWSPQTAPQEQGASILLITHSQEIARIADIVIRMRSGEIMSVTENSSPLAPGEVEW